VWCNQAVAPSDDNDGELLQAWRAEAELPVQGWDFSSITGRHREDQPPWSYDELAREVVAGAASVLDMGTGGGEKLIELMAALPPDTIATEGWPPNVPVAARNLRPHGLGVVEYDAEAADNTMPFADRRFDVVLNRHEAYRADEVLRILRPGGMFLTQQVDGRDFEETQALFGGHTDYPHITLANLNAEAATAGFDIERAQQWQGQSRFADIGAMVRYFTMIPWEVPDDFTMDACAGTLLDLHHSGPAQGKPVTFTIRRFYLLARRPMT